MRASYSQSYNMFSVISGSVISYLIQNWVVNKNIGTIIAVQAYLPIYIQPIMMENILLTLVALSQSMPTKL